MTHLFLHDCAAIIVSDVDAEGPLTLRIDRLSGGPLFLSLGGLPQSVADELIKAFPPKMEDAA